MNEGFRVKKLGELKASSLKAGDIIRMCGIETQIIGVSRKGSFVIVKAKMFEPFEFHCCEKVSIFY